MTDYEKLADRIAPNRTQFHNQDVWDACQAIRTLVAERNALQEKLNANMSQQPVAEVCESRPFLDGSTAKAAFLLNKDLPAGTPLFTAAGVIQKVAPNAGATQDAESCQGRCPDCSDAKPRAFSREVVRRVNEDMIKGKPVDTSNLPASIVAAIRATRYSRADLARAWKKVFAHMQAKTPKRS